MKTEYFDLKNKRALVSGGASGIGSSIVEHLCEQGVEVYFFDINKNEAKKNINKIKKKKFKIPNFEVRFHLGPASKVMKTQDGKTIYIDLNNEGWKFLCKEYKIDVETGLFFGLRNNFVENQNIVISGIVENEKQKINWELEKIQ